MCNHDNLDQTVYHDWLTENGYPTVQTDEFGDKFSTRVLYRDCLDCGGRVEIDRKSDYHHVS